MNLTLSQNLDVIILKFDLSPVFPFLFYFFDLSENFHLLSQNFDFSQVCILFSYFNIIDLITWITHLTFQIFYFLSDLFFTYLKISTVYLKILTFLKNFFFITLMLS